MWVKVLESNHEITLINLDDTFAISLTKDEEDLPCISVQSNKILDLEYLFGSGLSVSELEYAVNQFWRILKEKKDFAEITI